MSLLDLLLALALAQDPAAVHGERVSAARAAERLGDLDAAHRACVEAIAAQPDGPGAERCRRRVTWLEARRDEDGTWSGWTHLEALRRDTATAPATRAAALSVLATGEGVARLTRAEAALWAASGALDAGLPDDALTWARHAATLLPPDDPLRERAAQLSALALLGLGRDDEADEAERPIRVDAGAAARPTPLQSARQEAVRARLGVAALAAIGAHLVAASPALPGAPRVLPYGVAALALGAGATWAVAEGWADGAGAAVPLMLAGFIGVHLLALPALAPGRPPWHRHLVRLTAAAATLGVALLALRATDTLAWAWL